MNIEDIVTISAGLVAMVGAAVLLLKRINQPACTGSCRRGSSLRFLSFAALGAVAIGAGLAFLLSGQAEGQALHAVAGGPGLSIMITEADLLSLRAPFRIGDVEILVVLRF